MSGKIRLACRDCDRDDHDGVDNLPTDWIDIIEVQSPEEAFAEVEKGDREHSGFEWQTHLGLCPDCQQVDGH